MGASQSSAMEKLDPQKAKYNKDDLQLMINSGIVYNDYGQGDSFVGSFVDDWNKKPLVGSKLDLNKLGNVNLYHVSDRKKFGRLRFLVLHDKTTAYVIAKKGSKTVKYTVKL